MNWDFLHQSLDQADRQLGRLARLINWGLMAAAGGFGAWVTWSLTGAADLDLLTRLIACLVAAIICPAFMRLVLFVGRIFV